MSKYPITVTIKALLECHASPASLVKLGKDLGYSEPFPLTDVLRTNGLEEALWCLWALPEEYNRDKRMLGVAYARKVQHLTKNPCWVAALDVAERHANGEATDEDLRVARKKALDGHALIAAIDNALAAAMHAGNAKEDVQAWQADLFIAMCNGVAPWQVQMEDEK